MNWIIQYVILFVFASGLLVRSSAGIHLKFQPAERYEFCVTRNLSKASMFNEEDKARMDKILMETTFRMQELNADPANAANTKTMLRLFAAALACVVADCDSSVRPEREQACLTALESCAESLKERAGAEVVKEMKKIFSAMNREISTLDEISDNSASAEAKKKEESDKKSKAEREEKHLEDEIQKEKTGRLENVNVEEKEYLEEESEVKNRSKRAYAPPFRFPVFSLPPQPHPTLESVIADKLLKSATFNNFFKFGLSQEDAIFYSRSMVAAGLSGYRYDIIQEALNTVTSALTRLGSFAGSNDYAHAIARSIVSVLTARNLTMFTDGLDIGSSLVYKLDDMLGSNPSSTFSLSPSFGVASVSSSGWGSSSAVASSQTSGMASIQAIPSYVEPSFIVPSNPQNDKTQFQNRLSYFLSQSPTISETFCSGPVPGVYEIMNSAFSDYGYPISSTIATIVTNSLSMLPTEAACAQYADIISEIVADILDKNGLISVTDPQTIANKITNLISPKTQQSPLQSPLNSGQQAYGGSDYQLNPSFTDFSYSDPEIPTFPVDQNSDYAFSSSVSNTSLQGQSPVLANSTEFSSDDSPSVIQTSSKEDLSGRQPLSSDNSAATNNSWVIVDYPKDVLAASDQMNLTDDSINISSPIILEPGPVIPANISVIRNGSVATMTDTNKATTEPEMKAITKASEVTTPVPFSTDYQYSSVITKSEEKTTPVPQVALKDAFENPSKLSEFLMKEMEPSLKALNITSDNRKKQSDLPVTSGNSTGSKIPKTAESPKDSKLAENSPPAQDKPSLDQTNTEAQPSMETPLQQSGPSDGVPLTAPKPIMDELTALVFADKVSTIVSTSIGLIRSENLQFDELCKKLNELAPLVDLPPLDVFSELPLIDYLLHVLNAVTYSLAGER
ncbi:hypothetical protein HNY73_017630 [Argiope bruennichi]|uniref:Uncharacterized protein n=1 Tax=Argiope bruennichi TaxID=94029 RepID=A0A8T0EBI2_ARGBR|nr:hypothetical protein HNY73_017630 [Argiope bruennichi]